MSGAGRARARRSWLWCATLLLLAGGLFLGALARLTPTGVVFSGDGGTKLLLARQIAGGELRPDLVLPAPDWARRLWDDGLYPLAPPFLLQADDGRRFIGFPVPFVYVSALFLRAFGFRGTLLLPALATLGLWLTFVAACRRLRLARAESAAALALLIFATPATLYGAVYWEHAPALALAFGGCAPLLRPGRRGPGPLSAFGAGSLVGLSVWMREEMLALVAVVALWALLPDGGAWRRLAPPRARLALLAGLAWPLCAYIALNMALYGAPEGVRRLQLHGDVVGDRLRSAPSMLAELSLAFSRSFPLVALALLWPLARALRWRPRLPRWALQALALGLAFLVVMSPLPVNSGGKQFGPRYVLLLFPLGALVTAALVRAMRRSSRRAPARVGLAALAALGLVVAAQGVWLGPRDLAVALRRRALAVERLAADPHAVVAVSHTQVTQQIAWLADRKLLFHVQSAADFKRLAAALQAQGLPVEFTYLCHPAYRCKGFKDEPDVRVLRGRSGARLVARRRGELGAYHRYDVRLEP